MPFVKGQTGNPSGRKVGSKNRKTLLRAELEKNGSELAELIKAKAREGDSSCMAMWLARLDPPLRPRGATVELDLDLDAPLADQSKAVLTAVKRGELDVDTGKDLMDLLAAHAGMQDMENFLAELKKLKDSKTHIPGGVVTS